MHVDAAYCFCGHLRSFERTFDAFQRGMFRHLPGDIFFFTWNTMGNPSRTHWAGDEPALKTTPVTQETISKVRELYRPLQLVIEDQSKLNLPPMETHGYSETHPTSAAAVYFHWLSVFKVNQMRKGYELASGKRYAKVIRIRPDFLLHNELSNAELEDQSSLYVAHSDDHFRVRTVPDSFFHGPSALIDVVADFFHHIEERIFKRGGSPEDGFSDYLEDLKVPLKVSGAEWNFLRASGHLQNNTHRESRVLAERFTRGGQ